VSFKVINVDTTEKLVTVLVVLGSMPNCPWMSVCNRFHERLANNGKMRTFTRGTTFWCLRVQVSLNLENQDLDVRNLRLMLKILY